MEFHQVVNQRQSIRSYKKDPIPKESIKKIIEAIMKAPSACNLQPYRFIFVANEKLKDQICVAARNQEFILEAPMVIIACGNPQDAYPRMGDYQSSWTIDVAIAFEHLVLAAWSEGLGTCWIGSFDEKMVKEILEVPNPWRVLALTPLGYPSQKPSKAEKKSEKELINWDRFEI